MANVIWKNGTWTYGNWGGKGWSAGKFSLPNEKPDRSIDGVDLLDEVFKTHDLAYYDIQTAYNASAKTTADKVKYWQSIIEADTTMRASISALQLNGGLADVGAKAAADQANAAFAAKDAYNHLQLNAATVGGIQGAPYTGMPWSSSDGGEFADQYIAVIEATAKRETTASTITTPTDSAARNSAAYITDTNAASIAHKTARATNASGQALSRAQLTALDANGGRQLSEAADMGVHLCADMTTSNMVVSIGQRVSRDHLRASR